MDQEFRLQAYSIIKPYPRDIARIGKSFIYATTGLDDPAAIENFPRLFPVEFNPILHAPNHQDPILAQKYLRDETLARAFEYAIEINDDRLLHALALRQAFMFTTAEFGGALWTAGKIKDEFERASALAGLAQLRFYNDTSTTEWHHERHEASKTIILEAATLANENIKSACCNAPSGEKARHTIARIVGMSCIVGDRKIAYQTGVTFLKALQHALPQARQ